VSRIRHAFHLVGDLAAYSAASRSWWVLPVVLTLVVVLAVAVVTSTAMPYAMYTIF
jgi:hypothetical protein